MKNKLVVFGGAGTGIVALCCFTPVLVIAFTAVGAAAAIKYLDMVLFPALAFFLVMTGYGLYRAKQQKEECCEIPATGQQSVSQAKE